MYAICSTTTSFRNRDPEDSQVSERDETVGSPAEEEEVVQSGEIQYEEKDDQAEPDPVDTPNARKKMRLDARFSSMLDKVESLCATAGPSTSSRHNSFAKYLCDRLDLLPLPVARSLEIEILSRVHTVIDEFETVEIEDGDKQ